MKKFRLFDLLIIFMCIVAAVLFMDKIYAATGRTEAVKKVQECEMKVTVPCIEKEIAERLKVGDPFNDILQSAYLGKISNIEINEINKEDFTFSGNVIEFDYDRYAQVIVTVDTAGTKTDNGILIGTNNYLVGQTNTFSAGIVMFEDVRISGIKQ